MTKEVKKKRGRPVGSTSDNNADAVMPMVRLKHDQLKAYKAASERQGLTFSAWVRENLDKATK